MGIGVNFWVKKEAIRIIIYIIVITSISILANLKLNEIFNSKVFEENRLMLNGFWSGYIVEENNDFEKQIINDLKKNRSFGVSPINEKGKKVFLTFDDGPSGNVTPKILEILKKKNVKATFFLVGANVKLYPKLVKEEYEEGNSIGNHSYSHEYKKIYSNMNSFLKEVHDTDVAIKTVLGDKYNEKIFRFPGGAFNKYSNFKKALKDEGYEFYDWNCLSGDAEGIHFPKEKLISKVKNTAGNQEKLIILMHDMETKTTTYEALPEIIDYFKEKGYEFETL